MHLNLTDPPKVKNYHLPITNYQFSPPRGFARVHSFVVEGLFINGSFDVAGRVIRRYNNSQLHETSSEKCLSCSNSIPLPHECWLLRGQKSLRPIHPLLRSAD